MDDKEPSGALTEEQLLDAMQQIIRLSKDGATSLSNGYLAKQFIVMSDKLKDTEERMERMEERLNKASGAFKRLSNEFEQFKSKRNGK